MAFGKVWWLSAFWAVREEDSGNYNSLPFGFICWGKVKVLSSGVPKEALPGPPGLRRWQESNMGSLRQQAYINTFQAVYKYSGAGDSSAAVCQARLCFSWALYIFTYTQLYISFCLYILGYSGPVWRRLMFHIYSSYSSSHASFKNVYITKVIQDYYRNLREYECRIWKHQKIICYYAVTWVL